MPKSAKSLCYFTIKQEETTPEFDFMFCRVLSLSYGRPSKMFTTATSGFKFQTGRQTLLTREPFEITSKQHLEAPVTIHFLFQNHSNKYVENTLTSLPVPLPCFIIELT